MNDLSRRIVYRVAGMESVAIMRDLVYQRDGDTDLLMDVYVPSGLAPRERRPVVFFVHGGPLALEMQPPKEWGVYLSYGELAAASGLIGVTFNHRFYSPQQLEQAAADVAAAIAYVRARAGDLHADADRTCLWAFSGGGPLLSMVFRERPPHIKCVVAYYALLDLRHLSAPSSEPEHDAPVQKFSPAAYLRDGSAGLPVFVARAGLDRPVINQSIDLFVQEALAANALIDVANHPDGRHGFDFLDDEPRSHEIIARTLEFIKTHLKE
jgi:acetyl esterase/lipase